jgi:hypothetical protein
MKEDLTRITALRSDVAVGGARHALPLRLPHGGDAKYALNILESRLWLVLPVRLNYKH